MVPVIGITCKRTNDMQNYIDAIEQYGGEPRLFSSLAKPVADHRNAISDYLSEIDALLLPGGGDINPALFFEKRHPAVDRVSRSRDALEIWLCQDALKTDMPVLGVCRGIQIMNVAMRGSLYQDIPLHKVEPGDVIHDIKIEADSLLSQITGDHIVKVSSRHHQSLKVIGEGFVVTAQSEDGIVEAIENPSKRFVLGVQYHPEWMLKNSDLEKHAAKLFEKFIQEASRYKQRVVPTCRPAGA